MDASELYDPEFRKLIKSKKSNLLRILNNEIAKVFIELEKFTKES